MRHLPYPYVTFNVELAYASTAYGAQGQTTERAHVLISDHSGAAATYVGMSRGRQHNVAHLVADSATDARAQWISAFSRDRADLGPAHARRCAIDDVERYGSTPPAHSRPPQMPTYAANALAGPAR